MGKLIRKATGLTVGVATLLAGLVLPMTASAESASPIDASPIIHYSFDNALTSKTIANEGSAANSDATLSGDATVANGQISLTGSQTISVPTTAIAGQEGRYRLHLAQEQLRQRQYRRRVHRRGQDRQLSGQRLLAAQPGQPEWLREIRNDQCHCGRPE